MILFLKIIKYISNKKYWFDTKTQVSYWQWYLRISNSTELKCEFKCVFLSRHQISQAEKFKALRPQWSVTCYFVLLCLFCFNLLCCLPALQVSSSNATTISQPILQLSGDSQAQVAQVAQGQDLNAAGQTLQSVQLVNPGTFLIQAQTVTATGQIQWQTFQVS